MNKYCIIQTAFFLTSTLAAGTINFEYYQYLYAGSCPWVVAVGDLNSDTRADVAICQAVFCETMYVFIQNESGGLVLSNKYYVEDAQGLDIGDINNDNRNDVVLVEFYNNRLIIFYQDSLGQLGCRVEYPTCSSPNGVRIGDLNNDNLNDVIVAHCHADSLAIFYQNVEGELDSHETYYAQGSAWVEVEVGDVDNDQDLDVVYTAALHPLMSICVYKQNASGTLDSPVYYSVPDYTYGIAIGDLNNDARNDVAVTYGGNQPSSKLGIFYQDGAGSLSAFQEYDAYDLPEPVEIADFDLDGRNDVVVLNGGFYNMSVYQQNTSGTLNSYLPFYLPYATHYVQQGLDIGDINSDGKPDVSIADYNHGLVYLINASTAGIEDDAGKNGLKPLFILPNPSSGKLILNTLSENGTLLLSIFSVDGRTVYSKNINSAAISIDKLLSERGIFFIRISVGDEVVFRQKIVRL